MRAGIAVGADASASLHGSHFTVAGTALALAARGQCEATGNAFVRTSRATGTAVSLAEAAQAVLRRNVFTGYGRDLVNGLPDTERDQVRAANIVVPADAPAGR